MDQSKLSPGESISIIENAIRRAKNEKTGAAFYYVLWGIILFLYSMINYVGLKFPFSGDKMLLSLAWVVFPIGGLLSFLQSKKTDKRETVKPINENLYRSVWAGVGLCLLVLTVFESIGHTPTLNLGTILLLLGLASFITGGVTKFLPSTIGGALCIICAGITLILPLADQFLVCAIAMLFANVIPGILMRKTKTSDV